MIILLCILAFALGFILAWLIKKKQSSNVSISDNSELITNNAVLETEKNIALKNNTNLQGQIENLQGQLRAATNELAEKHAVIKSDKAITDDLRNEYQKLQQNLTELNVTVNNLEKQKSYLDAELKYKNEQLINQKKEVESIGEKFQSEFKVLAQKILDEKTETFNKNQEKSLEDVLKPLKDNITTFKTEIEARYNTENNERISLREQIKLITETNKLLSDQANNLTNALRGQVKQQGNWGEMILESILEHAGLTKNLHFFVQERVYNEEGQVFLPDVIVKYPDDRSIVIDSKVSLKSFEEYCNSKDVEIQQEYLSLLLKSIYSHIDNLSGKEYQQKANALDFVMLFIPAEGAYITAMQSDPEMWRYAYNKKVLLISPTNLIAAMKLVYDLWKKDGLNADANAIAEKAVKIYEKLAAFIEDFEKVGVQLNKASGTFNDAQKKLYTGKGNLLSQANQMKAKLKHNKPNRELPAEMLEQALIEEDMPEVNEPQDQNS
jgi:DNA recombination protein RmuC